MGKVMLFEEFLSEMQFAFANGHTNVCMGTEADGTNFICGTFGYVTYGSDEKLYKEIMSLITYYNVNTNNTLADIQAEVREKMK